MLTHSELWAGGLLAPLCGTVSHSHPRPVSAGPPTGTCKQDFCLLVVGQQQWNQSLCLPRPHCALNQLWASAGAGWGGRASVSLAGQCQARIQTRVGKRSQETPGGGFEQG